MNFVGAVLHGGGGDVSCFLYTLHSAVSSKVRYLFLEPLGMSIDLLKVHSV